AKRHIGRTGGGAKAAMHAFAQDGFGFGHMRIGKLLGGEIGLHQIWDSEYEETYPPLSLRDISPQGGRLAAISVPPSRTVRRGKRMISPLVGEMSRSDRGGVRRGKLMISITSSSPD